MNKQFIITPSHFFKLDKNPLWIWHDTFGDITKKEPLSDTTTIKIPCQRQLLFPSLQL